jgi:hypothetical protein
MRRGTLLTVAFGLAAVLCLTAGLTFHTFAAAHPAPLTAATADLAPGKAQLQSAGRLAFGPDGILFVGDSVGASIVALDTNDRTPGSAAKLDVKGINAKIASLLGTSADQILINDVKVNPISMNAYLSVSRGRGPDAMPVIVRVDAAGQLTALSLDNVKHSSISLVDAPKNGAGSGFGGNPRMQTITDMAFVNGNVIVAGLSNEEWSSALRSIPFPFTQAAKGATVQIWHASHGAFETEAPVRTFVPYTIQNQPYLLAAYTCTPLVKIPLSDLKPGAQVKGTTIADLGAGNRPLDMVPYQKAGHSFILIANSSNGIQKLQADNLGSYKPITSPEVMDTGGVPFQKISELKGVQHLAHLDDSNALVLMDGSSSGSLDLRAIALP